MRKHYREIDILKGLAIALVMLGHSIIVYPINLNEIPWCGWLHQFVSSAHMALFFMISGFCFGFSNWKDYALKKFKRIVIPLLVFGVAAALSRNLGGSMVNSGTSDLLHSLLGILTGGAQWFLHTLLMIFIIFPFFSKLYNGMIYPNHRWCYVPTLVFAYQIVHVFSDGDIKESLPYILIASVIYYGLCFFLFRSSWQIYALYFVMTIAVIAFHYLFKNRRLRSLFCLLVLCACLSFEVLYNFSMLYWGASKKGTDIAFINDMKNDEHSVFEMIDDDSFFRYSGDAMPENQAVQGEDSSTQYYWSIINNDVARFRKDLGLSDRGDHHFDDYDGRFNLNALACVRYFIYGQEGILPYGYDYLNTYNGYRVYKTEYDLPLVYSYDNYILYDEWRELSTEKRSASLLEAAVVNDANDLIKEKEIGFDDVEIVSADHDRIDTILVDDPFVLDLKVKSDLHGEYYVVFEDLDSRGSCNIVVSYGEIKNVLVYKGRDNYHYMGRHDYLIDLGYLEGADGDVKIEIGEKGTYTCSSIRIVCQPLERQLSLIEERKDLVIKDLKFSCNTVEADVSLNDDQILCFAIPYSKGWRAFVDGEEADLFTCNVQYMSLLMEKGDHQISLTYRTPLLKEGFCLSIAGTLIFVALVLRDKKK